LKVAFKLLSGELFITGTVIPGKKNDIASPPEKVELILII